MSHPAQLIQAGWSPLKVQMLLHFYAVCEPWPQEDAPACKEVIADFLRDGLTVRDFGSISSGYRCTEKGVQMVERICASPAAAEPVDMHGKHFLAGARMLAEAHTHSFSNMMQADGTRPGTPLTETIGLAAMEMQMLAERVARLYASPSRSPTREEIETALHAAAPICPPHTFAAITDAMCGLLVVDGG